MHADVALDDSCECVEMTYGLDLNSDLTGRPGFWGKALPERYVDVGVVFCFYFTASGDMMLNVDGHDKGVFLTGIDSRTPLWVMVDIYGNTTGVQFIGKTLGSSPPSQSTPPPASVSWKCHCLSSAPLSLSL